MARSILRDIRSGVGYADPSSQAGDDDAEGAGGDPKRIEDAVAAYREALEVQTREDGLEPTFMSADVCQSPHLQLRWHLVTWMLVLGPPAQYLGFAGWLRLLTFVIWLMAWSTLSFADALEQRNEDEDSITIVGGSNCNRADHSISTR